MVWKSSNQEHLKQYGIKESFWKKYVVPTMIRIKEGKCEICNSTKRLTVHHVNYQKQTIDNLKLVCFICHNRIHKEKLNKV